MPDTGLATDSGADAGTEIGARTPMVRDGGLAEPLPRPGFTLSRSLGLIVVLVGFVVGAGALADNSLLTHLATGDLILQRASVPSVDPYSATAAGEPWTVQSWLVSVLYAVSDRLVGLQAVRLLHGLVAAAIAGGLWQLTVSVRSVLARFALTVLPLLLGVGFWSPRPLMFGLAAMVVLLQVVQLNRSPLFVAPLMWLWANSHGSYPLAFVLLVGISVGTWLDAKAEAAVFDGAATGTPLPMRELRIIGVASLGTVAAMVGPLGSTVLTFPFRLLSNQEALDGVLEWQAPSFKSPWELLTLTLIPLLILAAKRGAGWRVIVPSVIFLCSAFLATRNIAVAAVVVTAMVAPCFADLPGSIGGSAVTLLSRTLGKAVSVGLVVATVAIMVTPAIDLKWYPEAEVDFLEERGLAPARENGTVIVHREAVGNYLTYRFGDRASVFIDDRFDFYPLDVITDHRTLLEGGDFREVLNRRNAEVILWQADEILPIWLAEFDEWQVVMSSDDWVVACRVNGPTADRCLR